MGSKERREREKLETRQLIMDAARELFTKLGFEAVTMRMIAEKVEYSPTAIYVHFEDKDALLRELCLLDFRNLSAAVVKAQKLEDPFERMRRCGRAYLEFALEHPNSYRLLFMTPHKHEKLEREEFEDPGRSAYAMLQGNVKYLIEKKMLKPEFSDVEQVAQVLWSAMHGVIALRLTVGDEGFVAWRPIKKTAETMMETLLEGMAAAPSARK